MKHKKPLETLLDEFEAAVMEQCSDDEPGLYAIENTQKIRKEILKQYATQWVRLGEGWTRVEERTNDTN